MSTIDVTSSTLLTTVTTVTTASTTSASGTAAARAAQGPVSGSASRPSERRSLRLVHRPPALRVALGLLLGAAALPGCGEPTSAAIGSNGGSVGADDTDASSSATADTASSGDPSAPPGGTGGAGSGSGTTAAPSDPTGTTGGDATAAATDGDATSGADTTGGATTTGATTGGASSDGTTGDGSTTGEPEPAPRDVTTFYDGAFLHAVAPVHLQTQLALPNAATVRVTADPITLTHVTRVYASDGGLIGQLRASEVDHDSFGPGNRIEFPTAWCVKDPCPQPGAPLDDPGFERDTPYLEFYARDSLRSWVGGRVAGRDVELELVRDTAGNLAQVDNFGDALDDAIHDSIALAFAVHVDGLDLIREFDSDPLLPPPTARPDWCEVGKAGYQVASYYLAWKCCQFSFVPAGVAGCVTCGGIVAGAYKSSEGWCK